MHFSSFKGGGDRYLCFLPFYKNTTHQQHIPSSLLAALNTCAACINCIHTVSPKDVQQHYLGSINKNFSCRQKNLQNSSSLI